MGIPELLNERPICRISKRDTRYLYWNYLAGYEPMHKRDTHTLHFRFSRQCAIIIGGYLCGLDLMGADSWHMEPSLSPSSAAAALDQPDRPPTIGKSVRESLLRLKRRVCGILPMLPKSSWRQSLGCGCLSRLALAIYLYFTLQTLVFIFESYASDFAQLRLRKLRKWMQIYGADTPIPSYLATRIGKGSGVKMLDSRSEQLTMRELEEELVNRSSQMEPFLILPGSGMADYGMLLQSGCMYLISLGFYIYFIPGFVYQWLIPFDIHIIRDLIDCEQEHRRMERICKREVKKYLISAQFHSINTDTIAFDSPYGGTWRQPSRSSNGTRASHLIAMMQQQGVFLPPNRSKHWIESRTRLQFLLHSAMIAYLLVLDVAGIIWGLILLQPIFPQKQSPALILIQTSIFGTILIVAAAASFLAPALFVSCWEQVKLVQSLLKLSHDCIQLNQKEFEDYQACAAELDACRDQREQRRYCTQLIQIADRMNANLLYLLVSFKIFMVQLNSFKRALRPYVPLAFIMALLMPIFTRLHVPYYDLAVQIDGRLLRWIAFALSSTILMASNTVLLPVCLAHSKCLKIYKSLASVMAHINLVTLDYPHLYDQHAVSTLKKKLFNPDGFLGQFVLRYFGIAATYGTWFKFHFWWGIVALSVVVDNNSSSKSSYGSLFQDPLGVYSF